MAIVMRIMLGANSVIVGLGQGFQPVCGYNYGAGLFARVKEGYWFCVRLATCVLVVLAVLLWVFAPQLVEIFRSDPAVVAVGVAALHIQCCTVILNGFNMMGNMMTQTMGRTGIASFLALCRQGLDVYKRQALADLASAGQQQCFAGTAPLPFQQIVRDFALKHGSSCLLYTSRCV